MFEYKILRMLLCYMEIKMHFLVGQEYQIYKEKKSLVYVTKRKRLV